MNLKLWDELAPLFEQALAMDADARTTFLYELKARNTTLWRELCSLLDSADNATTFLADAQGVVRRTLKAGYRHKRVQNHVPIWNYCTVQAAV